MLLTIASEGSYNATDNFGCLKEYNEVADFMNKEVERSLSDVKKLLEDTNIMVVDLNRFHLDAIDSPANYGFNESEKIKACCGYEGTPFNFNPLVTCGQNSEIKACSKPGEYICWDGLHFTDAFNQIFVEEVMEKMHYLKPVIA
ncbi:hypothetical protein Sjap_024674 [Stephania japonica]|uniref:Uncharacterized protein n=1 Tax=Stephania japonica TaxID=461633 RepID=A0AAP0HNY3_9MAGN